MGPLSVQIEPQTPIRRSKRRRELDDQLDREEKAAEPDHVETAGIEADVAPPKKARPHRKKAPKRRRGLVVKADPTDPSLLIPFGPAMAAKVLQKRGRGARRAQPGPPPDPYGIKIDLQNKQYAGRNAWPGLLYR